MRNSPTLTSSVDNQRYSNQPSFADFGTTRAPNPSNAPQPASTPTSTAPTFYSWLRPLCRQRISLFKSKALIGQLTELSKKLDIKARNSLTYVIIELSPILVSFSHKRTSPTTSRYPSHSQQSPSAILNTGLVEGSAIAPATTVACASDAEIL